MMRKEKLTISGFKCFDAETSIHLNNLTLLTGANSAGKSSVIQSILLAKMVSEVSSDECREMGESGELTFELSLKNGKYALELGSYDDIINRDTKIGDVGFSLNDMHFAVKGSDNENSSSKVVFRVDPASKNELKKYFSSGFAYLCADRTAPHYEYRETSLSDFCDCHGANVGDVFVRHQNDDADPHRSLCFISNVKTLIQIDEWCNYIFPTVAVRVERMGTEMYVLKIRNDVAPNAGFGITYALPVIISGLIIPHGGLFIVENPEAHLHAKAQSNMGYFLARIASAGVRVIVETHSEHVVNGIRRAVAEGSSELKHDDVSIYFFREGVKEITMDEYGNLSDFPIDFFDQVRQDMLTLMSAELEAKGLK